MTYYLLPITYYLLFITYYLFFKMEELTLTTPAFFGCFADFAGLYQSFFIVCAAGATVAGPLYGKSYGYHGSTNREFEETVESDTHDAGTGDSKPLFLCSQYVSYLHRTAVVIGLCIRTGIDTVNRFFGCILPRNTDFYPLAGDLSGSYGKRKDKEIARQGS